MAIFICSLCNGFPSALDYPDEVEAQRAAVWHTYIRHRAFWNATVGDREPKDPRPKLS